MRIQRSEWKRRCILLVSLYVVACGSSVFAQCCFLPPVPVSEKIARTDIALIAYCVSATPRDPERYDRFVRRRQRLAEIAERLEERDRRESPTNSIERGVDAGNGRLGLVANDEEDFDESAVEDLSFEEDEESEKALYGATTYEVQWIGKGPADFRPCQQIRLFDQMVGEPGTLTLLFGDISLSGVKWTVEQKVSAEFVEYLRNAPDDDASTLVQLTYYFDFLDSKDEGLAFDARMHFDAEQAELKCFAQSLPTGQLRDRFIHAPLDSAGFTLYADLISQVGNDDDAQIIAQCLLSGSRDELPYHELIYSYLRIMKNQGLDVLDARISRDPSQQDELKSSYCYALFCMSESQNQIPVTRERLKRSVRFLLEDTRTAQDAIEMLASLSDWAAQDEVASLYGRAGFDTKEIRRAVVNYLLCCCTV